VLLASRFLQGFGAASAVVLSRAIVRDIASGKEAARLMSLMTMIFTAIPVIAPSIGAVLVAHWGWRAPFWLIAVAGFILLAAVRSNMTETHFPDARQHPVRQLVNSFSDFFTSRQSIFGLLLIILPPIGFMSVITVSAALTVEVYGFSVKAFGLIFACAGVSIMTGAAVNRSLVPHLDPTQLLGLGIALITISSAQILLIAWLDDAPFAWLWINVCVFFLAVAFLMSNATVLALDPLPRIAGVASSIIGTLQNLVGATGAMIGAAIYNGSVRNSVIIIGLAGAATSLVFAFRPLIAPGPFVHHPDELARD